MVNKIASVAGWRKAIDERIEKQVKGLEWAISHMAHMKMEHMDGAIRELRWVQELISEFEASMWKLHDLGLADAKTIKLILTGETELRRVLEGEG